MLHSRARSHPNLPFTSPCVSVCRLPLFNYSPMMAFQLKTIPPLTPPHVALCSAQLFSLVLFPPFLLFPPPSRPVSSSLSCCQPFILSCSTANSPADVPPLFKSPNLEVSHLHTGPDNPRVCLLSPSPPLSLSPPSLHAVSSHVRETCRHPSATFDHCFCWEPSSPLLCLGVARNRQRVKE